MQSRHRRTGRASSPCCGPSVLQHLEVHPARPAGASEPRAAQGGFRGLPRRVLSERPGHPGKLRVPQSDFQALSRGRPGHTDREADLARYQPEPPPGDERERLGTRLPALDNHGMGSIFEELVRRFNEENNEEAGEHWTPRDAVALMAKAPLPARGRPDTVGHLPALRRRLRHRRHAHGGRRNPP